MKAVIPPCDVIRFASIDGRTKWTVFAAYHSVRSETIYVACNDCDLVTIHTGPVRRVEPMEIQGKAWLNVLDPGFNLHLREDLIQDVWVVEKPTSDGVVTSVEAFDARGELMAMFFGARKPGQSELQAWRHIVAHLQAAAGQPHGAVPA